MLSFFQKPSKEDLARKFTDKELTKLCLKRKCRVDMWKWNLVYEYRLVFEKEGRYQKWDDRKRQKMLKKAVNSVKTTIGYTDEEIAQARKKEWEWEKKESILSLNLWEYDERQENKNKRQEQGDETAFESNEDVHENLLVNTPQIDEESDEEFDLLSLSDEDYDDDMTSLNSLITTQSLIAEKSEEIKQSEQETILANVSHTADFEISANVNNEEELDLKVFEVLTDVDIEVPANTKENNLSLENNNNHLETLFDINTESMTIDTESLIEDNSEQLNCSLQTLSIVYNNFEAEIPITSTENLEFEN